MSIFFKEKEEPQKRIYTTEELMDFGKELEFYKTEKEWEGKKFKYLSKNGELSYLRDKGIWKKNGVNGERIEEFEEHENKMKQYWKWKGKGDFIFQKNIEDYEKIAKSFPPVLEEEIIPEEIPF